MTAYLFPGQGSQKKGMGELFFAEFPDLVDSANEILGYSIEELCIQDPNEQLNNTQFTQPALFVVNALMYLKKLKEGGTKPQYVLGHSLGEYNALWASGVFDFKTGVLLVQKRGELMSQVRGGGMAAVIGLTSSKVQKILQEHSLDLTIANYNSYQQQVLSGSKDLIQEAKSLFTKAGAKLYLTLPVTGAFHAKQMHEKSLEFKKFLQDIEFNKPQIPVIANLNALPYREDVKEILTLQIDNPVRWLDSILLLISKGITQFEEVGPGKVLQNLTARIISGQ